MFLYFLQLFELQYFLREFDLFHFDLSYLKYQDINGYLDYWNSNATVPVNSSEIVNIKDNSDIIQEYTDYYEEEYDMDFEGEED